MEKEIKAREILKGIRYAMNDVLGQDRRIHNEVEFVSAAMIVRSRLDILRVFSVENPKLNLKTSIIDSEMKAFEKTLSESFNPNNSSEKNFTIIYNQLENNLKNILSWCD